MGVLWLWEGFTQVPGRGLEVLREAMVVAPRAPVQFSKQHQT